MAAPHVCGICYCDVEPSEAFVSCQREGDDANPHYFHADGCLPQYFSSASQDRDTQEYYAKHTKLRCPSHHEGCLGHLTIDTALRGGAEVLSLFVSCTTNLACTAERRTTVAMVEREAMKASSTANQGLAQRLVADVRDVLTNALSCPHCKAPFIDFSGCLSLTCGSCSKEFCGVCCKKHGASTDGHKSVTECLAKLSPAEIKAFDFHSTYFISAKGWAKWSDQLKVNAVMSFLHTLRRDLVWDVFGEVDAALRKEKLLSPESCELLAKRVYSHDVDAVHLVRIPNTFWLLYSTKKQQKFEDVVRTQTLTQQERIDVGKLIVARIRKQYPSWVAVKNTVPGEAFEAINYPPELLPLITKVMDEWGRGKYW